MAVGRSAYASVLYLNYTRKRSMNANMHMHQRGKLYETMHKKDKETIFFPSEKCITDSVHRFAISPAKRHIHLFSDGIYFWILSVLSHSMAVIYIFLFLYFSVWDILLLPPFVLFCLSLLVRMFIFLSKLHSNPNLCIYVL